jgi:hypothetical protein
MTLKSDLFGGAKEIFEALKIIINSDINPADFLHEEKIRSEKKFYEYKVPKYDRYAPDILLKRQVIQDYIDIPAIREQVNMWGVCDDILV